MFRAEHFWFYWLATNIVMSVPNLAQVGATCEVPLYQVALWRQDLALRTVLALWHNYWHYNWRYKLRSPYFSTYNSWLLSCYCLLSAHVPPSQLWFG